MSRKAPGLLVWIVATLAVASLAVRAAEERIWLEGAKVNDIPAKIFLDTGAGAFYLFRSGAERLGFDVPREPDPVPWRMYFANEKCRLQIQGFTGRVRPVIAEPPSYLPIGDTDGFVGWKTIHDNIVQFDANALRIHLLENVPAEALAWTRVKARMKASGILVLEIPNPVRNLIIIDTGSSSGVGIPSALWDRWKAPRQHLGFTLAAGSMPSAGLFTREQTWTRELTLGPLELTNIVVEDADPWSHSIARDRHLATFGLGALKRIDLIVDGKNGLAFLRAKQTPAPPPNHNRLGAIFIPREGSGDDLIAQVLEKTPAAEAGLRDGDVLLKVDGRDVTAWRQNMGAIAGGRIGNFWERPAGTVLRLTLRRGSEIMEKTAVLRDILGERSAGR